MHNNIGWNVKKYESFCDCSSLILFSYDLTQKLNKSTFCAEFMRFLCNHFSLFSLAVFSIVFSRSFHISLFLFYIFCKCCRFSSWFCKSFEIPHFGTSSTQFELISISFPFHFSVDLISVAYIIELTKVCAFCFLTLKSWNSETLSHCRLITDTPAGCMAKTREIQIYIKNIFENHEIKTCTRCAHDAANFSLKLNWPIETF